MAVKPPPIYQALGTFISPIIQRPLNGFMSSPLSFDDRRVANEHLLQVQRKPHVRDLICMLNVEPNA